MVLRGFFIRTCNFAIDENGLCSLLAEIHVSNSETNEVVDDNVIITWTWGASQEDINAAILAAFQYFAHGNNLGDILAENIRMNLYEMLGPVTAV